MSLARSCILCRRPGNESLSKPCGATICTIFGIQQSHPFKDMFDRGKYCGYCLEDVENAQTLLGRLGRIKESLLQFQTRVYTKLSDNYFQIEDKEELDVHADLFDDGEEGVKGRTFSYNQLITAIYGKFKKDTLQWETFSTSVIPPPQESDSATRPLIVQPLRPPVLPKEEEDDDDSEVPFYDEFLPVEAVLGEEDQSMLEDDCGPDQSLSKNLIVNMKLHRAVKQNPNLKQIGHSANFKWACVDCSQKFRTRKDLRVHRRTHVAAGGAGVGGGGFVSRSKKKNTKRRPRAEEEKVKRRLRDQAGELRERCGVVMMTQPVKPAQVVRDSLCSRRSERMKVVKGEEV